MPKEHQQEVSQEPAEHAQTTETAVDQDIRRAEFLLQQSEELIGEALDHGHKLSDAAWRLTLARWSLGRRDIPHRQWPRQAAILAAAAATTVYLIYRLLWTMNLASPTAAVFSAVLLAAECYAGVSLGLYLFQIWRLVEPPIKRPKPGRTVDVFVTTYNEDVSLLRGTLLACAGMDYPHATYVLDDGARDEVRQLAESLGVRYISRTDRTHAKAGNLNNALRQTGGEFVVMLDADHVPYRHYITRLIGYFDDPRMGFVQAPHTTYNLDNFMGRWKSTAKAYWEDVRIFFEAVQLGKNRHGVACFCGSAAIFRRKALEEVGLLATETITEDLHTGMRINAAGWKSIAVGEEMVVGLAPDDAATFASQRLRWGEGNLSVLAYDNPLTMKGLTPAGRINYLASIASWTLGPPRLILYLTPLVMLFTGISPVAEMSVSYFAVVAGYLLIVWSAIKISSNRCGQLLGIEMAMMASFHLQLQALWRALFRRRRQRFVVTEKRHGTRKFSLWHMWPQAALVAAAIIAFSWAAARVILGISADYLGLFIGTGLAVYHSGLALSILERAMNRRSDEVPWRHPLCMAVSCTSEDGVKPAISIECNEHGCRLLGRQPLNAASPLAITFHSPVGTTTCHGRIAASTSLGRRNPFAYVSTVVFAHEDPAQQERERDSLREIIFRYVVPVVTETHRLAHKAVRALPGNLSGEGDFPMPVTIEAKLPNIAVQKSVALSMSFGGFLAVLKTPYPIDNVVQVTINTPIGPIVTEAEVYNVETMRVGADILYQHDFCWHDRSAIRRLIKNKQRWQTTLARTVDRLRNHRLPLSRLVAVQLGNFLLVFLTLFVCRQVYLGDRVLIAAARQAVTPAERSKVEAALRRLAASPRASTGRLLRIYEAADAIGDHARAADAAERLAGRIEHGRCDWMLSAARHLAQTNDRSAADAAFDRLLAEHISREFSLEEQAAVYTEAARAAVAVGDLEKAVDHFLEASNLTTTNRQQAEELLGVLIAAKRTKLALAVLDQLKDKGSQIQLATVLEMEGNTQQALQVLLDLEKTRAIGEKARRSIARLLLADQQYAAAAARLAKLLEKNPSDPKLQRQMIEAVAASERWSETARRTTLDVYRQYRGHDFQGLDAEGFERLGDALRRLGLLQEAGVALERAVAEFPNSRRLRLYLAQTLSDLGRYDDAERQYQTLLSTRTPRAR